MAENSIAFGPALTVKHVEAAILALQNTAPPLAIDLTHCQQIDLGAGWRLGCMLRRFSGNLHVAVPAFGNGTAFGGDWFRLFTRSGLGWVFARHASRIMSGRNDISSELREYYALRRDTSSTNHLAIVGLHEGASANVNDADVFQHQVLTRLRSVAPQLLEDTKRIRPLIRLCFEAIQNVYDHAPRQPLVPGTRIESYFTVAQHATASASPEAPGDYYGYLKRLPIAHESFSPTPRAFVELLVVDDGVGVAARQALEPDVYQAPIHLEDAALTRALADGGSIKLVAKDCPVRGDPGYGFAYVKESLQSLFAYAQLRTGRRLLVFDPTTDNEAFRMVEEVLGYMPGTALHVTIPLIQRQPVLFPR